MAAKRIGLKEGIEAAARRAADVMENGGVAVFPTETVYGIGVVSGNADALAKLRRLKGREDGKPFQYLAGDLQMAKVLGAVFHSRALKLANNYWPGPLTLVVPDGTHGDSTIGIRIPDSAFAHELCRLLGRAIISSSANAAGQPPPLNAEAADVFGDAVDLLVDGGPVIGGVPSTVVECFKNGYRILREGAIHAEAIESAWNE